MHQWVLIITLNTLVHRLYLKILNFIVKKVKTQDIRATRGVEFELKEIIIIIGKKMLTGQKFRNMNK